MAKNPKSKFLGEVDVIIIGGGPAGTSTALHMQRLAPDLIGRCRLLEKSHHPREKICGGALTINAERILSDLDIPLDIPFAPVHHVQLIYGNARIDLPEGGCAKRVIRRCDFDNLLFQTVKKRGVPTIEGVRVSRVIRRPDHLRVVTDKGHYRAQVVVGADGVGAVLRKTTGFGPGKMGRLWVAEVPADPTTSRPFTDDVLIIDLSYVGEGLRGYYWEFPCYIEDQPFLSIGIVDSNPKTATRVGSFAFLAEVMKRRGINAQEARWKAFPIRHFSPRERFSRPRMLLTGDALGSDPLFSEGISQALEFGRLSAEAVVDGFERRDLSFSAYTSTILRSRAGKELAAYARASRFFYGRHAELFLSMLYETPELRNLIGCSYAGTKDMHNSMLRLSALVAKHLFHARKHVGNLRAAAALGAGQAQPDDLATIAS
ncbi:MAG: NAD(P)/FAD-dependent oxidoreductase [bacterium]|nr:NAD(P)/FAD-dependent oxidoreductase [bacterium]